MSQTVMVSLGGQQVPVIIEGGNMGNGASVGLQELNVAVGEAKQAAADAEASAAQASTNGAAAGATAGASAGSASGAISGDAAGTAAANLVVGNKVDLDAGNITAWDTFKRGARIVSPTLAALKAITAGSVSSVFVEGRTGSNDGYAGVFEWVAGDQSDNVANDPLEGVWVAPSGQDGSTGAWKRVFSGPVSVLWFGATGGSDDSASFDAAGAFLEYAGGGTVRIPAGTWYAAGIKLRTGVYFEGVWKGATVVKMPDGANTDVFVTKDFDALTGVGPLVDAPMNFGVSKLTINGNYLDNWLNFNGSEPTNNLSGKAIKIFGSRFLIDVEMVNVPDVGFYSETAGYSGYTEEVSSRVRLTGRVFRKEAVVFRGPGDIVFDRATLGVPFWQPTVAERQTIIPTSDYYGAETHLFVADENGTATGHHEIDFAHLYGNQYGYGYWGNNSGRINASILIVENNRGGAWFGDRAWGSIGHLNCWNWGRSPLDSGGVRLLGPLPAVLDESTAGLRVGSTCRNLTSRPDPMQGLVVKGENSIWDYLYFSVAQTGGAHPPMESALSVEGRAHIIRANVSRVRGDAVRLRCSQSQIHAVIDDVKDGSGLVRHSLSGSTAMTGNIIKANIRNSDTGLNLDGQPWFETLEVEIDTPSGGTMMTGDAPLPRNRRQKALIQGRNASGSYVSNHGNPRGTLDTTTTGNKTVVIDFLSPYTPGSSQLVSHLTSSPAWNGKVTNMRVTTVTDTQITVAYTVETASTTGDAYASVVVYA